MTISHQQKLVFIHVHRTGGTAFENVLKRGLNGQFETHNQHDNAKIINAVYLEKQSDYFIFGFTRNPWERILSWYSLIHFRDQLSIEEERGRFEKFLETNAAADFSIGTFFYNSIDYFTNKKGDFIANKIFRYEEFINEIKIFSNQFNISLGSIPVLNNTNKKNYKEYYTDKSSQLITEKCKKDIDYFGYRF